MRRRILSTQDFADWYNVIKRLPQTDVYFLPEYHRAYELNGDGKAYAFVAEEDDHVLFYPFFVRPIEKIGFDSIHETWYDIETVYGYTGPLCTTTNTAFLAEAWDEFGNWCKENHIIAEFLRFNPMIENHRYVDTVFVQLDRETVMVKLDCSEKELWESYPSVQRNMVRKAIKKGMICEAVSLTEGLGKFKSLYRETMNRVDANQYYHFSDAYFNNISSTFEENIKLFVVRDEDRVVAAALFFLHGKRIHYHLAGSTVDYRKYAPNNLLLHTVAQWGGKCGFHWLHLGGGRTAKPDDDLLRFKMGISQLTLPFYTGRRVHNQGVYERFCMQWMEQKGISNRPPYFLLYRL